MKKSRINSHRLSKIVGNVQSCDVAIDLATVGCVEVLKVLTNQNTNTKYNTIQIGCVEDLKVLTNEKNINTIQFKLDVKKSSRSLQIRIDTKKIQYKLEIKPGSG